MSRDRIVYRHWQHFCLHPRIIEAAEASPTLVSQGRIQTSMNLLRTAKPTLMAQELIQEVVFLVSLVCGFGLCYPYNSLCRYLVFRVPLMKCF